MNHEHFREHMALRLYGELDLDESKELDGHLAQCEACRRYQAELTGGLGRVRALTGSQGAAELPTDWSQRLAAATRDSERRSTISPWLTTITSFAAGILVAALVIHRAQPPTQDRDRVTADDANYTRYLRSTPPPLATGGGQLTRLRSYVKR